MLMNSVDNIAYNNGTLEKEFHYFTIKEHCPFIKFTVVYLLRFDLREYFIRSITLPIPIQKIIPKRICLKATPKTIPNTQP